MKKRYRTDFQTRQYMLSRDYEIFYYSDRNLGEVALHFHDYYEFYFFLEGDVSIQLGDTQCRVNPGDFLLVPPGLLHRPIIHSPAAPLPAFCLLDQPAILRQSPSPLLRLPVSDAARKGEPFFSLLL